MRHARRHGNAGHEFGGSGEDSFVAVVVTKLTGALLFILLLTMVIMALLPKAVDLPASDQGDDAATPPPALTITTPETLPEAIAGRPYVLALAASGGRGTLEWSLAGPLPAGLALDPASGRIAGTPERGTPKPAELVVQVSDGTAQAAQTTRLLIYQSDKPLTTPAWWKPGIPPVPWRAWLEQGFGFLVLWLVHLVGMNTLGGLQRWSIETLALDPQATEHDRAAAARRFATYRWTVRLTSLAAAALLAAWLWRHHA
jgi:Putative Ig domain